jgi:hypothetical protein
MKKLAKDITDCSECPLNGNDCVPTNWDGREAPCNSWNGDEIIEPYMYSVAAELYETKRDLAIRKQAKRTRENYSGFDFHMNVLKKFVEESSLYCSNLQVLKRDRYIAYIGYGGFKPAFKFNLKTCEFEHPYKLVKNYYYSAYMLSNDFYDGVELSKKWVIQDNLMKRRPLDDNFYKGFEKFEKNFKKYFYKKYEDQLRLDLEKNSASKNDYKLISNEMILNSIKNGRKPEDLAWAIIQ